MINVEGNYEEIVEWMDEHPVEPVEFVTTSHGWVAGDDEDRPVYMNVGLFSLNEDIAAKGTWICCFDRDKVLASRIGTMTIEDPENTHKIRF